jgi:hypothetical protein
MLMRLTVDVGRRCYSPGVKIVNVSRCLRQGIRDGSWMGSFVRRGVPRAAPGAAMYDKKNRAGRKGRPAAVTLRSPGASNEVHKSRVIAS